MGWVYQIQLKAERDEARHQREAAEVAEQEANAFAGALLVPAAWLRRDLDRFPTASALADRYQVSREVIFIAAQRARLLGKLR